jgi:hypothetical protein
LSLGFLLEERSISLQVSRCSLVAFRSSELEIVGAERDPLILWPALTCPSNLAVEVGRLGSGLDRDHRRLRTFFAGGGGASHPRCSPTKRHRVQNGSVSPSTARSRRSMSLALLAGALSPCSARLASSSSFSMLGARPSEGRSKGIAGEPATSSASLRPLGDGVRAGQPGQVSRRGVWASARHHGREASRRRLAIRSVLGRWKAMVFTEARSSDQWLRGKLKR